MQRRASDSVSQLCRASLRSRVHSIAVGRRSAVFLLPKGWRFKWSPVWNVREGKQGRWRKYSMNSTSAMDLCGPVLHGEVAGTSHPRIHRSPSLAGEKGEILRWMCKDVQYMYSTVQHSTVLYILDPSTDRSEYPCPGKCERAAKVLGTGGWVWGCRRPVPTRYCPPRPPSPPPYSPVPDMVNNHAGSFMRSPFLFSSSRFISRLSRLCRLCAALT